MKYLITAFLIFIVRYSFAQVDSLKKYSYFIYELDLYTDGYLHTGGGTGFFVRRNGNIYFVTAKHCVSGCHDSFTAANERSSKTMKIWINGNDINSKTTITVDVSKYQDTSLCPPVWDSLDAIAIKLPLNKLLDSVYSVENFIGDSLKVTESVTVYGYPNNGLNLLLSKPPLSLIELPLNTYKIYDGMNYTDTKKIDSLNYLIYPNEWSFGNMHGYSGSPVFIMNWETKKHGLVGVLCAGGENSKRFVVAKINLIKFE